MPRVLGVEITGGPRAGARPLQREVLVTSLRSATALVAVLALLQPSGAEAVVVSTQNVRRTLSPPEARQDLRQAAVSGGTSILFTQEMSSRRARLMAPSGWDTAHFWGADRRGDCATFWDRSVWARVRVELVRLTYVDSRWALVVLLRRRRENPVTVATICVHMITEAVHRPAAYRNGTSRLHRLATHLERRYPVIIGGDWNLGHQWDVTHHWHGFPYARFTGWASGATAGPTLAHHCVDYFYWTQPVLQLDRISRISPTFSDHDGVRIRLLLDPGPAAGSVQRQEGRKR